MKIKHYLACLSAALMLGTAFTACGNSSDTSSPAPAENTSSEVVQEAPETSPVAANGDASAADEDSAAADDEDSAGAKEVPAVEDIDFEPSIAAESGQAYLAINEGQGWIQYWGKNDDIEHTMLTYNAGVADITGNGSYTVSVTTDTKGYRYDTTKDPDDDSVVPQGLMFASVMVRDGEELFPGMVITIDSIIVDGKELELTAKNYTSSDDGVETRSNIYNQWVGELPEDARSTEGDLYGTDLAADYSPIIVNPDDFTTWKTVEVNFTVSGIGEGGAAAEDAGSDENADAGSDEGAVSDAE